MSFLEKVKILVVTLSLFLVSQQTSAKAFIDVPHFHKNAQAIHKLSDLGIINGYPDGSFQPAKTITRAEAAKLLISSIKSDWFIEDVAEDLNKYGQSFIPFWDVTLGEWYTPYVTLANQYGIATGYSDGSFQPGKTINFAEGLKMVLESYDTNIIREPYIRRPLLLVNQNDWFAPYFMYAYNRNLINTDKFYHPGQPMTRGDFTELIYRIKTMKESETEKYSENRRQFYSDEYTITIPKLNLINVSVGFADPYDSRGALQILSGGLGHYLSPPGSGKKMVLFGHSSGFNWDTSQFKQILRQIDQLQNGDVIYINYQEKGYAYRINKQEVMPAGQLANIMHETGHEELAVYTCWPPDSVSHRYVIYAHPIL